MVRCIEKNELVIVGQELPSMAKGMGGWVFAEATNIMTNA